MTTHRSDRTQIPAGPPPNWAWDRPEPPLPPHTPGLGARLLRERWGADRVPDITPEGERFVDELIQRARRDGAGRGRDQR
ncbi:hypothetical protein GCM10007977_085600 [Dactylosporangium sucinum]|uniref:Uncharacterized protein n=1 Tax=Dactylosporangium sucinum TaxID=1424081 RepID=A0A917UAF8_9ACTN|nr:hypothetical protein GCM10007977_085600 [Dactylosporangium sucinum]